MQRRNFLRTSSKAGLALGLLGTTGLLSCGDGAASEGDTATKTSPEPAAAPQKPRRRRKTGLDLLIRSTVADEDRGPRGAKAPDTKRVTLIFNKEHLATLKEQAKERGMYLKDVVQEMVAGYLEE